MSDARPRSHLTPPAGWMNDPNGLFFHDGRLHVFYQHNPSAPRWDRIHWGHAVTDDLVDWEHWPVAISPAVVGPDADGCWSGCVVDDAGTPSMVYTGIELDGALRRASICLARSTDGLRSWSKDAAGPIIAEAPVGYAPDCFRDPFVWREAGGWAMLVGAGNVNLGGAVLLFRSADLHSWEYVGPWLTVADLHGTADTGGPCWECPQLLHFGPRAVLIVSITDPAPDSRPSHVIGVVGRIEAERFVPDDVVRLDAGPDFYAPATVVAPDGRNLLFGWIPEDPPEPGSGRDWAGALTLPREVRLDGDRLSIEPATEVASLRGPLERRGPRDIPARDGTGPGDRSDERLPTGDVLPAGAFEVQLTLSVEPPASATIELRDEATSPEVRIAFRPADDRLSISRRGTVAVGGPDLEHEIRLPPDRRGTVELRIIVDGSVMEAFVGGAAPATFRLPTAVAPAERRLVLAGESGPVRVHRFDVWSLRPTIVSYDGHPAGAVPGGPTPGATPPVP